MKADFDLKRFTDAQRSSYEAALSEVRSGRKRSHWMWFIFPQVQGLGFSETARYYGIGSKEEARAYTADPVLGPRLLTISRELLHLPENNPTRIFGTPDDLKLRSSMTLFASVPGADPVFQQVLDKFFQGAKDARTLQIIEQL